ncbi:MAG: hypothetical protein NZ750_13340 [Anaerolineae bacterium]|nr:hypothetical protein [Anaerolineae bacterium]MDW8172783.1 hypothetical protein [Anaerolineae bacterium]
MKLRIFALLSVLSLATVASVSQAQVPCVGLTAEQCASINQATNDAMGAAQPFAQGAMAAPLGQAQINTCFGLPAPDCALVTEATVNTLASAMSFAQDWTIDFSVNGVPGSGPVTFNVVGSGPVVIDMSNPNVPLKFDQTMNVRFSDGTNSGSGPVQARIVDGIMYIDFGQGWRSIDLMEAANNPDAAGQLPINPEDLMSGEIPGLDALGDVLPTIAGLLETPGFLSYTRSGADFTFVADLGALFKDPNFSSSLMGLSAGLGEEAQQVTGVLMFLPMLLNEGKITVVQTVDEGAKLVTGLQFLVNASINAGMLGGDSSAAPIVVDLKFTVKLSRINESFDIVAPEGATPLDLQQLPLGG